LRFYHKHRVLESIADEKMHTYLDMLPSGEHIILDVDHWLLFLKHIELLSEEDKFWEEHKRFARSHAEQLRHKIHKMEDLLKRFEICNLFKISEDAENEFTLILGSDLPKNR
jgi:hypothetical protein